MKGNREAAATNLYEDSVMLHELEQSNRETSWKHTRQTRGILQQRNFSAISGGLPN
jgi:hypothetical protein